MLRIVFRSISTTKKELLNNVVKSTRENMWKGVPDYDLDVNPYKIKVKKENSLLKEKNKSNK